MIRSLFVVVVTVFLGISAAPSAAAESHPDLSPFEIPTVTMTRGGFGTQLELACKHVVNYEPGGRDAPQDPAPADDVAGRGITPPPPFGEKEATMAHDALMGSGAPTAAQADAFNAAALNLKEICANIATSSVSDADLVVLREMRDSGTLPALTQALIEGSTDKAELANKARAAAGTVPATALGAATSLTGIQSQLFNGLADFLVTRSKEEAILYLQHRLGVQLCGNDEEQKEKATQELKDVLPNTCALLKNVDASLSLAAMGAALNVHDHAIRC